MKTIGHKSGVLKTFNIIFLAVLAATIILFMVLPILDYQQTISYLFMIALFAWLYLPIKEIKKLDKRFPSVVEANSFSLKFRDLSNKVSMVRIEDIKTLKVTKLPFVKYGSIVVTTDLRKVKCVYIKDVLAVVAAINKMRQNDNKKII